MPITLSLDTLECAISALRVMRASLDVPSHHYTKADQLEAQAEIDAALAELMAAQAALMDEAATNGAL